MKAIQFKEQTVILAENQPEYTPLPVFINDSPEREMVACFELSQEEMDVLIKSRQIWFTQFTFGNLFQPVHLQVQSPFATNQEQVQERPLSEYVPQEIFERVHQAIGTASMCWESPEKAGVFQSTRASDIAYDLCARIGQWVQEEVKKQLSNQSNL